MRIEPFTIQPPDGIDVAYGIVQGDEGALLPSVLVVAFVGTYPDGSLGSAHGHFIAHATLHGLAAADPWCLILDLRRLSYRWGNTLLTVFEYISRFMDDPSNPQTPFPVVLVTSDLCRDAVLSLITRPNDPAPPWHFDDIDQAIPYAIQQANTWINT